MIISLQLDSNAKDISFILLNTIVSIFSYNLPSHLCQALMSLGREFRERITETTNDLLNTSVLGQGTLKIYFATERVWELGDKNLNHGAR